MLQLIVELKTQTLVFYDNYVIINLLEELLF